MKSGAKIRSRRELFNYALMPSPYSLIRNKHLSMSLTSKPGQPVIAGMRAAKRSKKPTR
jgi:hypothetical protein